MVSTFQGVTYADFRSGIGRFSTMLKKHGIVYRMEMYRIRRVHKPSPLYDGVREMPIPLYALNMLTGRSPISNEKVFVSSPEHAYAISGNKGIIVVHDLFPLSENNTIRKYYPTLFRFLFKKALSYTERADTVVVPSNYTKDELYKYAEKHDIDLPEVRVIPHAPDDVFANAKRESLRKIGRRVLKIPENAFVILNVEANEPRKNLETFYKVVDYVSSKMGNVYAIRVGRGENGYINLKLSEAKVIGVDKKTHLTDVSDEDLAMLYAVADVVLVTSFAEGFGFPIIESLAVGTPVVTTPFETAFEFSKHTRGITLTNSFIHVSDIGYAVIGVLKDPPKVSLDREVFSVDTMKRKYLDILERLN